MGVIEIDGYHGTCSSFKESIEKNGLDPELVNYRDDHWLGQGVYFFTDEDQAIWWANDISSKNKNIGSYPVVYQARIQEERERVLDLDNNNDVAMFFDCVLDVLEELRKSHTDSPIFNDNQIRAVFFDYYKKQFGISVIICTFPKKCVKYTPYFQTGDRLNEQKKLADTLKVYFKEQQICVSNRDCIKYIELVYDGKEEVI